jgi:hypothetical protein
MKAYRETERTVIPDQLVIRRSVVVIIRDPKGLIGGTTRGTATGVDILHEVYFFAAIGIDGNI